MKMPGFTAEESFYKANGHYRTVLTNAAITTQVVPQRWRCPPPGLCAKASRLCDDPEKGGQWCGILDRCFDCWQE